MTSNLRLSGKIAVITGGTSGIGEEIVKVFAENGASVVVVGTRPEEEITAPIGSDKISYYRCDVRDEEQIEELVNFTLEKYGRVDILICCAAIMGPLSGILEFDSEGFDNTMAINVRGIAVTMKHFGKVMVERNIRGSIICMASLSAIMAGLSPLVYTTGKHALLGLVKGACSELGVHGIKVNCISPTGVPTPVICGDLQIPPVYVQKCTQKMACLKGSAIKLRDVAEVALFLASDESAYVSGHNLVVDGGTSVIIPTHAIVGITKPIWE